MFNNRLHITAMRMKRYTRYFYDELRKRDSYFDPEMFMAGYNNYLNYEHNLDEDEKDYALTFAAELALNKDSIYYLDELYYIIQSLGLDENILTTIALNIDEAVYIYTMNHFSKVIGPEESLEFDTISFLNQNDTVKRNFVSSNKDNILLDNNHKVSEIYIKFKTMNIYLNKMFDGDIERAVNLTKYYNQSKDYMLPLVYHNKKTHRSEKYYRERAINSNKFIKIVSDYIYEDVSNRVDIIKSFVSQERFEKICNESYPDLFLKLQESGISLDESGYKISFSKLKDIFAGFEKVENKRQSKYFKEFSLPNSSIEERKVFDKLEKLGLYAIPAKQAGNINLVDDEGQMFGFRIDFLLPCNVREYDGENYTLRSDIIFVGEYFGYYGTDYETKKKRKIIWQNNLENALDQRCLHIDDKTDFCTVLREKNIDSKCYPDFSGELYSVKSDNQKKTYYLKSQIQHFLYQYLVNELLWEINYDYSLNTLDNYNRVKENNGVYLDRFERLLLNVEKYGPSYLVEECAKIVDDYKKNFDKKKRIRQKSLRLSFVYNYKKSLE